MKHKITRFLLALGLVTTLASPLALSVPALALECSVLPDKICKAADKETTDDSGVMELLKFGIRILTGLIGIVAVGAIVWAGILYASASDKADQVSKAKNMITQTIIGVVLYGLLFLIMQWLIPGGVLS